MKQPFALTYQAEQGPPPNLPLGRYLPPLPGGAALRQAQSTAAPGSWVLDPLGASPTLPLELAQAGYRVLVVCNNPVLNFMLETLARAPQPAELNAVLSDLAAARRGEERLERYLTWLYTTACPTCGQPLQAQAFIWQRDANQPHIRQIHCAACGAEGDFPTASADIERLAALSNPALARARALERVAIPDESHFANAKETLQYYLPRSLVILFTLINKSEGLPLSADRRQHLQALLISACDEANTLWPWPAGRLRPRQLTVPPIFREKNLWRAIAEAVPAWCSSGPAVPLTHWPDLPPETGGICVFAGRLKNLLPLPETVQIQTSITVLPRPNQAFWTLSALWSGWLWGREALVPLRSALERRRYDWAWYAAALHSACSTFNQAMPAHSELFAFVPELSPSFLTAAVLAGESAGLQLKGLALREEEEMGQILWRSGPPRPAASAQPDAVRIAVQAVETYLNQRGEPAPHLPLYAAGLQALAVQSALRPRESEELARIQTLLSGILNQSEKLTRHVGPQHGEESGSWWLAGRTSGDQMALADRVEMETIHFLQKTTQCTFAELDAHLCRQFGGLFTPPADLVRNCLESYALPSANEPGRWQLNTQDAAAARQADLRELIQILHRLAGGLGCTCEQPEKQTLLWKNGQGEIVQLFYLLASGIVSRFVLARPPAPPERCILVMPGSRSQLLVYKLRRDPRLALAFENGWRVLKFRYLRELARRSSSLHTLTDWQNTLDGDPPAWEEAVQMSMF